MLPTESTLLCQSPSGFHLDNSENVLMLSGHQCCKEHLEILRWFTEMPSEETGLVIMGRSEMEGDKCLLDSWDLGVFLGGISEPWPPYGKSSSFIPLIGLKSF